MYNKANSSSQDAIPIPMNLAGQAVEAGKRECASLRGNRDRLRSELSISTSRMGTMSQSDRRTFLAQLGSAAIVIPQLGHVPFRAGFEPSLASASPQAASSTQASGAPVSYDLLIAGGRVIDPSQKLSPGQCFFRDDHRDLLI